MFHKQPIASLVATCLLVSASVSGCKKEEPEMEPRLRAVKYVSVEAPVKDRVRTFSGVSQAGQESRLSFKVSGSILALLISVGDRLEPGQLIAELDPASYELETQRARADLAQARANERNADANYKRVQDLYENNNASRTELDTARANAESSRAQVRAAQKGVDLAQLQVSYTKLVASAPCWVADISVEVNENINAGQEVAMVACGDSIEIEVPVPESVIGEIQSGMNIIATFDALPEQQFNGVVTEVAVAATSGATFPVTVSVPDTNSELRSGLAAQVSFRFDYSDDDIVLSVPPSAVSEDQNGHFVFLLQSTDKEDEALIKRQKVDVSELTADGIKVLEGISEGDKIVTAGVSILRDGMRVKAP